MEINDWKRIFGAIEHKLTENGILQVIKAKLLNGVRHNNRDILQQIRTELQKQFEVVYEEWEQKGFDINHLFNLSWTISPGQQTDEEGTLLEIAVRCGHLKIAKYLIDEKNADPNPRESCYPTLLHLATYEGHLEIVKYLIDEKNLDPKSMDGYGYDSFRLATRKGHLEILKYLMDEKKIYPVLRSGYCHGLVRSATRKGHLEILKYLIDEKKIDPSLEGDGFDTPLHLAVGGCHLEIVKYLIDEKKIDPSLRDNYGWTPLHLAARKGNLKVVKYLIDEKNADPSLIDNDGHTPLYLAVYYDIPTFYRRSAKLLIAYQLKKDSNAQKPEYLKDPGSGLKREMSEYWDKCLDEIERMKQGKIDRGITLYDVLVSKNNGLAFCIRNENVRNALKENDYKSKFPVYANDLELQFKVGKQRLDALNVCETIVKHFDGCAGYKGQASSEISGCLSNEDMKNLRKAAIQTMDKSDYKPGESNREVPGSFKTNVDIEYAQKKRETPVCVVS